METSDLLNAAKIISRRNINEHIIAVGVIWDGVDSKLTVKYYVDQEPTDDEIELCELSLTELLSEFSDVRLAETVCTETDGKVAEGSSAELLVYAR